MPHLSKRFPAFLCWIFFCVLASFFILECDDLYFQYWTYDSVTDFLLTNPAQADAAGVPQNGRYAGNALGILLSKLQYHGFGALRAVFLGSCLFFFCCLAGRWGDSSGRAHRFWLGFAGLVLCPVILWKEVLSWSASFCNYLIPILFLLLEVSCFRFGSASPLKNAGLFLLAFLGQLFSETMTAFFLLLDGLFLLIALAKKDRAKFRTALCLLSGALLGAGAMFSDSGYTALDQDPLGRSIGISGAKATLFAVVSDTIFENIFAQSMIALLFHRLFRCDSRRWVRASSAGLCITVCVCCALSLAKRLGLPVPLSVRLLLCLGIAGFMLILYLALKKSETKLWIGVWAVCYLGMTVVLMLINPISPRHYFLHYILLFLTVIELYNQAGWLPAKGLAVVSAVTAAGLLMIYHANFTVDQQRTELIHDAMEQGRTAVTLPLVPHPQYTINETTSKGDVSFIYYYDDPWDIRFTFVPRDQWTP